MVFYSRDYTAARYAFETVRKADWIAESLAARPIEGVVLAEPRALTQRELERVHAHGYVEAVRTGEPRDLAESNGFPWDPGVWIAVCASNGGAVDAALHALRTGRNAGSLSSGLHHARAGHGAGFCTFNGLALAARAALEAGARGVLIVDLDAHCGGGTWSLVQNWPGVHQLDIAVSAFDMYGAEPAQAVTLDIVHNPTAYSATLATRLRALSAGEPTDLGRPARLKLRPTEVGSTMVSDVRLPTADARPGVFDLLIYNAGMDVHEASGIGGLPGMDDHAIEERERMVFEWAREHGVPVAFVLAGGYRGAGMDAEHLVELHRMTLELGC